MDDGDAVPDRRVVQQVARREVVGAVDDHLPALVEDRGRRCRRRGAPGRRPPRRPGSARELSAPPTRPSAPRARRSSAAPGAGGSTRRRGRRPRSRGGRSPRRRGRAPPASRGRPRRRRARSRRAAAPGPRRRSRGSGRAGCSGRAAPRRARRAPRREAPPRPTPTIPPASETTSSKPCSCIAFASAERSVPVRAVEDDAPVALRVEPRADARPSECAPSPRSCPTRAPTPRGCRRAPADRRDPRSSRARSASTSRTSSRSPAMPQG